VCTCVFVCLKILRVRASIVNVEHRYQAPENGSFGGA
jgi:hypothetical protein